MQEDQKIIPFKAKLGKAQLINTIAVLAICTVGFAANTWYTSQKSADAILAATASVLTQNLESPLLFHDLNEVNKTLNSLENHPSVRFAAVFDFQGKEVATFPKNPPVSLRQGKPYLHAIGEKGEPAGTLALYRSEDVLSDYWRGSFFVVMGVLLLGVLISRVLTAVNNRTLSFQFSYLIEAIQSIRQSNNFEHASVQSLAQAKGQRIQEFWDLAGEFDLMFRDLKLRDQTIQEINSNLEKQVEQRTLELKEAQASLVQSSRLTALGEMSASLAHEINNPLAIIAGKVSNLKRSLEVDQLLNPEREGYIQRIEATTLRISKIIHGLKSFSRDGSQDPFEIVKFNSLMTDVLEVCNSKLKQSGVAIKVENTDPDLVLSCRATQIGQIIINLINNAVDAVAPLQTRWVQLSVEQDQDWIVISVTDSGPGIPAEIRAKLMQSFFTTKGIGKGTGLGLSISSKIASAHGGSLSLDENFKNTRFLLKLPKRIGGEISLKRAG